MPKRFASLKNTDPAFNPLGVANKVRGGALATQSSRDQALYAQMRCIPHGARVVAAVGLNGQVLLAVPDGIVVDGSPTQDYPGPEDERVLARQVVRLTPGYVLQVWGVFLPSGAVQAITGGTGLYDEAPPHPPGSVRVDVSFSNGAGTSTVSRTLIPALSDEPDRALPTGQGGAWSVVHIRPSFSTEGMLVPQEVYDIEAGWTEGVSAVITITAVGGARPVDICVFELPYLVVHDEEHREGTCPLMVESQVAQEFPITGYLFANNARWGSMQADKSLWDQRGIYGPTLVQWSCWSDGAWEVGDSEGHPQQITQTSFRDLHTAAITTWDEDHPGWSVSSGGYGRGLEQSGSLELRAKVGVIPVTVRVWAKMSNNAHVGTVRFQTAAHSLRDITVTGSTAYAWYTGLAWLQVPVHASVPSVLQVMAKVASIGQTLSIRYVSVEYGGHHVVAQ